jgi:hypothetical protein
MESFIHRSSARHHGVSSADQRIGHQRHDERPTMSSDGHRPVARGDLARFDRLRAAFADRLAAVGLLDEPAFVRDDWRERATSLGEALRAGPPRDFLRRDEIRYQMFVGERYLEHELPYVLERVPDARVLAESAVGGPPVTAIDGEATLTSPNAVHHAHHLLRYEELTGRRLDASARVVEWGAGYGSLARVLLRLHRGEPTVVLIDLPVYSALQWLYLASVLGDERVVLHDGAAGGLAPGRVNVVPVGLVTTLDVRADLFISTWALNESARPAQQLVLDRDWFGAQALLIGMHHGDPLERDVLDAGATAAPIGPWMPGQHYFVR